MHPQEVYEYADMLSIAEVAANTALQLGDLDTHQEWVRAYHRIADECLARYGVEFRPR